MGILCEIQTAKSAGDPAFEGSHAVRVETLGEMKVVAVAPTSGTVLVGHS